MEPKIIGVDLDGVLYNFTGQLAKFINRYNRKPLEEMPPPSNWFFWEEWGMTKEDWLKAFSMFGTTMGFASGAPIPGSLEVLRALSAEGHIIRIVTARANERNGMSDNYNHLVAVSTLEWLRSQKVPFRDLFFTADKGTVMADIFIDDAVHHLEAIQAAGRQAVCFDQLYNQEWQGARVNSWDQFAGLVRTI